VSTCRSCGAEVVWAVTPGGKRMPVDPEPVVDGNVHLDRRQNPPLAQVIGSAPTLYDEEPADVYVSHFATCPNADRHRRSR
jgi:hypothetical protein